MRLSKIKKHILCNLKGIKDLYKYNLSCPMESQISHNIADLFTSRQKAYSIKMIIKLTELRLLYKNYFKIKELFLNNFNYNEKLIINNKILDFSIFGKKNLYHFKQKIIYNFINEIIKMIKQLKI